MQSDNPYIWFYYIQLITPHMTRKDHEYINIKNFFFMIYFAILYMYSDNYAVNISN